jgi:hypothetical protein
MLHASIAHISQETSCHHAPEANPDFSPTALEGEEPPAPTVSPPASESRDPSEQLSMHSLESIGSIQRRNSPSVSHPSKELDSNSASMANSNGSAPNLEDLLSALHERRHLLMQQQQTSSRQDSALHVASSSQSLQFLQELDPNLSIGNFSDDSWINPSQVYNNSNSTPSSWSPEGIYSNYSFIGASPTILNSTLTAPVPAMNSSLQFTSFYQPAMPSQSMLLPDVPSFMPPQQRSIAAPSMFDLDCSLNSAQFQPNHMPGLPSFTAIQQPNPQFSFPVNSNYSDAAGSDYATEMILPNPMDFKANKRSASSMDFEPVPASQVTPKVAKPLQEQNERQHRESQAMRSQRFSSLTSSNLLHTTCKLFPQSRVVVESALQCDPEATGVAIPILCSSSATANSQPPDINSTSISNYYSFPINIALQYDAAMDVIELLVKADPHVLTKRDGPNQAGSLSIALSTASLTTAPTDESNKEATEACSNNLAKCAQGQCCVVPSPSCRGETPSRMDQLVALLLRANRGGAKIVDRRNNTPLHYLARGKNEISCASISLVYSLYPEALHIRNWLGQTPLQVAQRNLQMSDVLLERWIHLSYSRQEYTLEQSLQQIDGEIDESERSLGIASERPVQGCDGSAHAHQRASTVRNFSPASSGASFYGNLQQYR